MNTRRSILLASVAAVAGCATRLTNEFNYDERFDSLAISADGGVLLVMGAEFDYVFRPPRQLIAALHSELRRALSASFVNFELNTPTDIKGEWHLVLAPKDSNENAIALAKSLGFTLDEFGQYILKGSIEGTRYLKNSATQISTTERTNQVYVVRVSSSHAFAQRTKIENSPVSNNNNGALILGLILLSPLILILKPCFCK